MLLASLAALWASLLASIGSHSTFALAWIIAAAAAAATTLEVLLKGVLTPILAWLSEKAYGGFKTIFPWWDKQSATVHQAVAPVFGFVVGLAVAFAGVPNITDLTQIDSEWIKGLANGALNAAIMAGLFRSEKAKTKSDATVAVETSRASQPIR